MCFQGTLFNLDLRNKSFFCQSNHGTIIRPGIILCYICAIQLAASVLLKLQEYFEVVLNKLKSPAVKKCKITCK